MVSEEEEEAEDSLTSDLFLRLVYEEIDSFTESPVSLCESRACPPSLPDNQSWSTFLGRTSRIEVTPEITVLDAFRSRKVTKTETLIVP